MATITKRGKSFILTWSEGGKQYRRSIGPVSRTEAEAVLSVKQAELKTGQRFYGGGEQITFASFVPDYTGWHKHEYPSSHKRVGQIITDHLGPSFGHCQLGAISPRSVERWKAERLRAKASPATVGKELRTLKAILNAAVKWGVIDRHYLAPVKAPKLLDDAPPPYYTKDQLTALYDHSVKHGQVWKFMANTGLRRAEMMAAKRQHLVNGCLRVLSTTKIRTKSAKWRQIPLSPGAVAALDGLGGDFLAPRINPTSLSRAFVLDALRANLGGSIHWLRHTFCSHLVMAGVDLRTVQELAGHASYKTTLNYAHLAADHLSAAVAGLKL